MSDTHTKSDINIRDDTTLIESLRNMEGLKIEVLGSHFKRVESEDQQKAIWYVWGEKKNKWYFSSNTWVFEAAFQLGQDNA